MCIRSSERPIYSMTKVPLKYICIVHMPAFCECAINNRAVSDNILVDTKRQTHNQSPITRPFSLSYHRLSIQCSSCNNTHSPAPISAGDIPSVWNSCFCACLFLAIVVHCHPEIKTILIDGHLSLKSASNPHLAGICCKLRRFISRCLISCCMILW